MRRSIAPAVVLASALSLVVGFVAGLATQGERDAAPVDVKVEAMPPGQPALPVLPRGRHTIPEAIKAVEQLVGPKWWNDVPMDWSMPLDRSGREGPVVRGVSKMGRHRVADYYYLGSGRLKYRAQEELDDKEWRMTGPCVFFKEDGSMFEVCFRTKDDVHGPLVQFNADGVATHRDDFVIGVLQR